MAEGDDPTTFSAAASYRLFFDNCTISDSSFHYLFSLPSVYTAPEFTNCRFENVTVSKTTVSEEPFIDPDHPDQGLVLDGDVGRWLGHGSSTGRCIIG